MRTLAEVDWKNWEPEVATLLFVVRDAQILLIRKKRGLGAGKINGPGGRLEPGETALQCAVRETQEELCITAHDPQHVGENLFQFVDGYALHVHVYTSTRYTGEPKETDEAVPLWFPVDSIPYHEMWEDDQLWLPRALRGERFHGRYIFDGDRMLDHQL